MIRHLFWCQYLRSVSLRILILWVGISTAESSTGTWEAVVGTSLTGWFSQPVKDRTRIRIEIDKKSRNGDRIFLPFWDLLTRTIRNFLFLVLLFLYWPVLPEPIYHLNHRCIDSIWCWMHIADVATTTTLIKHNAAHHTSHQTYNIVIYVRSQSNDA